MDYGKKYLNRTGFQRAGLATLPYLSRGWSQPGVYKAPRGFTGMQEILAGGILGAGASKFIPEVHGGKGPIPADPPETFPAEDTWDKSFKDEGLTIPDEEKIKAPDNIPPQIKVETEGFPDQSEEFNKPQIYYNEKVGKKMLTKESTDYRLQHKPRGPDDEYPVRLDNLTQTTTGESAGYPKDFYSGEGKRIYAPGPSFEGDEFGIANNESYNIINSVKGNPDTEVTIYRAVPNEKNITKINPSDFVTLSKRYADLHAAGGYGRDGTDSGKVLELKVKVKDIYWDQNDVNEFGYFPDFIPELINKELEDKAEHKFQYMANKEGGQTIGNREVILKLDKEIFNKYVKELSNIKTFEKHEKEFPNTYVKFFKRGDLPEYRITKVGQLGEEIVPELIEDSIYNIKVKDFNSKKAIKHSKIFDSDVYPDYTEWPEYWKNKKATGGLIDKPLPGGSRYI